jgi:hypothetical protein
MSKTNFPLSFMKRSLAIPAIAVFSVSILMAGGQDQNRGNSRWAEGLSAKTRMAINTVGDDLDRLNESHEKLIKAAGELGSLYLQLSQKVQEVSRLARKAEKSGAMEIKELFQATRDMQEMQMSFNLQYLQLQNEISKENRQFSMVSNIMKNKHDTAKDSINIIR